MSLNETIFVTGFPGFLATRLVKRLAAEGARFILLTQPPFVPIASEAAGQIARATGRPLESFEIVDGDITKPDLGMDAIKLEKARQETSTVFHLAAIYDLAVAQDVAATVNVEGTMNMNQFAKSVQKLRRYHYVSTCYVAGRRQGLIKEDELHHEAGFQI